MNQQVGIVGVGNMGEALLSGLLKSGTNSQDIIFAQQSDDLRNGQGPAGCASDPAASRRRTRVRRAVQPGELPDQVAILLQR